MCTLRRTRTYTFTNTHTFYLSISAGLYSVVLTAWVFRSSGIGVNAQWRSRGNSGLSTIPSFRPWLIYWGSLLFCLLTDIFIFAVHLGINHHT